MKKMPLQTLAPFNEILRNSIGRSPGPLGFLLIPLLVICFALLPRAEAAPDPPAPPATNTADGQGAMANITIGVWNAAFGQSALFHLQNGFYNTAVGGQALFSVTGGAYNTGVGLNALY